MLIVLLAKTGQIRLHQIEQLADNSGDAAVVARTAGTLQHGGNPRYVDIGLLFQPLRIDIGRRRGEHQFDAAAG
ncbi:hypothetical protein D3C75_1025220 [compost metagenome]